MFVKSWITLWCRIMEGIGRETIIVEMPNKGQQSVRNYVFSMDLWWRHHTKRLSTSLVLCEGNRLVDFPDKDPVNTALTVLLSWTRYWANNPSCWWFEKAWRSYDVIVTCFCFQAVGEPPLLLATSVFFALKDAIYSARRQEADGPDMSTDNYFRLDSPATVERIRMACLDRFKVSESVQPP